MRISIITLFPEVFDPILNSSILKRAQKKGKVEFEMVNLRKFGQGIHQVVDSRPYGGGAGMILRADILSAALKKAIGTRHKAQVEELPPKAYRQKPKILLMSASGTPYKQAKAQKLSKLNHLIIVCGHYEGVDQRFIDKYVTEEISIGDYVLTGGEIPAMVIVDSLTRLIPGVLEKPQAVKEESFSSYILNSKPYTLLEYPHYTRPEEFEGEKVPGILLSGNHQKISEWRSKKAIEKTRKIRPDLIQTD